MIASLRRGETIVMPRSMNLILATGLVAIVLSFLGAKSEPAAKVCPEGYVLLDGACMTEGAAAAHCGPGYRPESGSCVEGYRAPDPDTPLTPEQDEALKKGCARGQVWSAAEGCHEDD
jgi:hypothetical protein